MTQYHSVMRRMVMRRPPWFFVAKRGNTVSQSDSWDVVVAPSDRPPPHLKRPCRAPNVALGLVDNISGDHHHEDDASLPMVGSTASGSYTGPAGPDAVVGSTATGSYAVVGSTATGSYAVVGSTGPAGPDAVWGGLPHRGRGNGRRAWPEVKPSS